MFNGALFYKTVPITILRVSRVQVAENLHNRERMGVRLRLANGEGSIFDGTVLKRGPYFVARR